MPIRALELDLGYSIKEWVRLGADPDCARNDTLVAGTSGKKQTSPITRRQSTAG